MPEKVTDSDALSLLRRLVTEMGTPRLLRLIATVADQHARDLVQHGPGSEAARLAREAEILSRASDAIAD